MTGQEILALAVVALVVIAALVRRRRRRQAGCDGCAKTGSGRLPRGARRVQ